MSGPIDIVIPWVDNQDAEWQKQKKEYSKPADGQDRPDADIRFQSWDNLHLWFRAIEKFMPWVNRIFLITCGHLPEFLNKEHPKLRIVKHSEYIPEKYLPTFNSNTIEMNVHRLEDLSENFILFNDDLFPLAETPEEYYFRENQPCDMAVENIITAKIYGNSYMARYTEINNLMIINRHFDKREVQQKHPEKWFCKEYGELLARTEAMKYWYDFSGFYKPHFANAFKKSTLKRLWELEGEVLDVASSNRFRAYTDISQYVIRYWQLCEGNFYPRKTNGKYFLATADNCEEIAAGIRNRTWPMVCFTETCVGEEFKTVKRVVNKALEELLPEKSSFEL